MKKLFTILAVMAFTSVAAVASVEVADKINMKEAWNVTGNRNAVIFDHKLHAEKEKCTACHATEEGGKIAKDSAAIKGNNERNVAHATCWPCHVEKKVPKGKTCTNCHKQ